MTGHASPRCRLAPRMSPMPCAQSSQNSLKIFSKVGCAEVNFANSAMNNAAFIRTESSLAYFSVFNSISNICRHCTIFGVRH